MKDYFRLASKVIWKGTPEQVIFFVTAKCNFNCKMCFYKGSLNLKNNELSLDEIKKISLRMPDFSWMQISGGEPFIREDLDQICGYFVKNNKVRIFNIPTNGFYFDKISRSVERMLKNNPKAFFNLGISLLGLKNTHEKITGVSGSFDNALACFWKLKQLKNHYPNLGLHFTVNQSIYNQDELKQLFDFLFKECRPEHIGFNLARGRDIGQKYSGTSVELYLENWHYLLGLALAKKDYYFKLPLRSIMYAIHILQKEVTVASALRNRQVIPCLAGRVSVVMDETGNLFACEMRKRPLGNLRESGYDFNSIWNSRSAGQERGEIRKSRCFCTHECLITTSIVFNPLLYPGLFGKWFWLMMKKNRFAISHQDKAYV